VDVQQRGKAVSDQRDVGSVAEHRAESGIVVDDDAVESDGEHGYRQSVQQYRRRKFAEILVRAARRGVTAPFGGTHLSVGRDAALAVDRRLRSFR
jgi:hypothetical protein